MTGNEYNLAIHPDFVNDPSRFNIVSVTKCILSEKGEYSFLGFGIKEDDKLIWKNLKVEFIKADTSKISIYFKNSSTPRIIQTAKEFFIQKNKEYNFKNFLDNVIEHDLKNYIENNMSIKLSDPFMKSTEVVNETFQCPFTEKTILKNTNEIISHIYIQVQYKIKIIESQYG